MPCFYLKPAKDDLIPELQVCLAEALYDVDSIVADPGAYTKEELRTLHDQIVSNLERDWEISGGSEDQLNRYGASDFAGGGSTIQESTIRVGT